MQKPITDIMNLNQGIAQLLKDEGCRIFGFADLTLLPPEFEDARRGASVGIIIGEPYGTAEGIREMLEGKPGKFGSESGATFEPLNRYKAAVKGFLKASKYKSDIKYLNTTITFKMLATLAGIGWIGRCAVLTTKEWGPSLRLSAIATDAPLECGTPITKSLCPPDCFECADICPVNAIKKGVLWERFPDGTGVHRDEFFDVKACRIGRKQIDPKAQGEPTCGLCICACPFTKKRQGHE